MYKLILLFNIHTKPNNSNYDSFNSLTFLLLSSTFLATKPIIMKPIRLYSHFYPFHSTYITKPNKSNSKVLSSIQFFYFPSLFLNFLGYQTERKETNKTWTMKRISISQKISSRMESNHKNKSQAPLKSQNQISK